MRCPLAHWEHILGGFLLGDLHGKKFLGRSPIPLKRMSMAECSFLWGIYPSMGRRILGLMAISPREMHPWQDAPLFVGDLVDLGRVEHFVKAVSSHENAILRKRSQVQREQKIRFGDSSSCPGVKKVQSPINRVTDVGNPVIDQVKLGEEGWKERYYAEKFEAKTNDDREKIRGHSVLKYIEGICWVMHYYYQGVCSWQWFYPYHYAPFASDFCGLDQLEIHFVLGKPFKPFDQLMGVLPAARFLTECLHFFVFFNLSYLEFDPKGACSAHALPFFYRKLMTDSSSPILDFYPEDFELDMNGKRFLWQAICKLPFIKESRLLFEIGKVEHTLTEEEKRRNSLGLDILCIHKSHPLSTKIFSFWERNKDNPKVSRAKVKRKINAEVSGGMNGYIYISDEPVCPSEINPPTDAMVMITDNKVMYVSVDGYICIAEIEPSGRSVFYKFPCFHPHIPKPPEGVNMPAKFVRKQDVLPPPVLWHDRRSLRGRIYSERPIPNSISGSRLEKLAHRLVCKYYLAKEPGSQGSMEVGSDIVVDAMASQPNLKVTVSRKELDAGGEHFIVVERTKTKRKRGSDSQKSASIGVDDLASQSSLKAAVSGKEKEPGSQGSMEVGSDIVVDAMASQPNLKVTVSRKELDAGGEHFIVVERTEKKRKRGSDSQKSASIVVDDLASQSILKAAVSGKEKEPGSQGSMEVGSDIVVDAMASQPNLKVTVSRKELDAGGEHFIVVERTEKKRKQGSDSQKSASIGVDDLASQSNLKAAVSGTELDAGTGNCIVVEQVKKKRKQGSVSHKNRNKRWRINQAKRQQALANGIAPLEPALI
ncbi:hypothetical protein RHSIM_Rhsim03G0219100 [Rhododendron simsii]|uniref:Xrn1 helical domain-containing protein n=1 Tax=Rhododendron simsii TaxID=118357 RepID=A0A834H7P9_RHOSS|nr:hypothetical protein RHSIM_Rhsim03G0219100 [Rhododendron simsii]